MPHARVDRFDSLDALRALAILWMTGYHFAYDLNHFGFIQQSFGRDPVWTWQRTAIVSSFVFLAGVGQAVAAAQGQSWPRFWRRWAQVALCALLVSAATWVLSPRTFIYFGVLHGLAVMLVIARATAGWGPWLWPAGALALAAPVAAAALHAAHPALAFLNEPAWNWLGWISRKPVTGDYVPVFPWLGVMWWGVAFGQAWLERAPVGPVPNAPAGLAWMGRHSLAWYMLHQPVLYGAVALAARLQ